MPTREHIEDTLAGVVKVVKDIITTVKQHLPAVPEGKSKKEAVETLDTLEWSNNALNQALMSPSDKLGIDLEAIRSLLDTGCEIVGALKSIATDNRAKSALSFAATRLSTQAVRLSACKMS